ncbi:MAG: phosphotransferase family protein [bacterium]|nr:phosphotransferase family protein [bacterium]
MISQEQVRGLEAHLSSALGEPCTLGRTDRMSMGQSRAMYIAELECERSGRRKVVIRVEQWGLLGGESRDEVRVMRALHGVGFPVAEVISYEPSCEILGQPFFVMEFVEGTSVFTRESLDPYVDSLARLHRLELSAIDIDFFEMPKGPRDSALLQVERWYDVYRSGLAGEPSPLVEEAAQWLRNNAPETEQPRLVHGDPGPGNYLHEGGELRALVDWEFTHLGDPEEDWAYLIAMRGMGVMTEDAWVAYLADQVGIELDRDRLAYWIALNLYKGACIDQTALGIFIRREYLAPNLLAIGTCIHLSALKRLADTVL